MKTKPIRLVAAFFIVFLSMSIQAVAQDATSQIVIGERIAFQSDVLDEERMVLIGLPREYDQSSQTYPVLVVLDGDTHFKSALAITDFLALNEFMPDVLVVGIENTIRIRDMTPPADDPELLRLEPEHGGSADFRSFISTELLPWLDANYRTHCSGLMEPDTLMSDNTGRSTRCLNVSETYA